MENGNSKQRPEAEAKPPPPPVESKNLFTIFVGTICVWGQIGTGLAMGYSAFLIPQLEAEAEAEGGHLSTSNKALIGSLSMVGMMVTSVSCGVLADTFGRKKVLLALYSLGVIGFIMPMISNVMWLILLSRVVQGVSVSTGVALIYLGEVASGHLRTMLCSACSVGVCLGAALGLAFGSALHYFYVSICCAAFPATTLVVTAFLFPESPSWLYLHGQRDACLRSLAKFQGKHTDLTKEVATLEEMALAAKAGAGADGNDTRGVLKKFVDKFTRPEVYKPCLVLISLMVLLAWSGGFVIMYYAVNIFKDLDVGGNAFIPAIVVSLVRALGAAVGTVLIRKWDNKVLLFYSSLIMCFCELFIGFLAHFHHEIVENVPEAEFALRSVLPVVLVVVLMLAFGAGVGTVPMTLIGILAPPDASAMVSGVTMFSASALIFSVLQAFPFLEEGIGQDGIYWLFAIVSFLMAVAAVKVLPQTRGLTRAQISQSFRK